MTVGRLADMLAAANNEKAVWEAQSDMEAVLKFCADVHVHNVREAGHAS